MYNVAGKGKMAQDGAKIHEIVERFPRVFASRSVEPALQAERGMQSQCIIRGRDETKERSEKAFLPPLHAVAVVSFSTRLGPKERKTRKHVQRLHKTRRKDVMRIEN